MKEHLYIKHPIFFLSKPYELWKNDFLHSNILANSFPHIESKILNLFCMICGSTLIPPLLFFPSMNTSCIQIRKCSHKPSVVIVKNILLSTSDD